MKRKAKYIVVEGTEGVGKGTQTDLIVTWLRSQGKTVLKTSEPGTPHSPLTMDLRKIALDASFDLPKPARELIIQTIRSIHLEKVILPALENYDYIIQDRGILSGLAYGEACENDLTLLKSLTSYILNGQELSSLYDQTILLLGDSAKGLTRATLAKREFQAGDVMEMKGSTFVEKVRENFLKHKDLFKNVSIVNIDGKDIPTVFEEIKKNLI